MYEKLRMVLIAEDATDQRLILRMFVERLGLSVVDAQDGLLASQLIEEHPIDFQMPNMAGADLVHWCRSRSTEIPIIVLSSEAKFFENEASHFRDCCSIMVQNKPISFIVFESAIKAADKQGHSTDCPFKTLKQSFDEVIFSADAC